MFKWIKNHKCIFGIVSMLLVMFFILLVPLIINKIYYTKAICNFFIVGYSIDYILGYYGNVLTFVGTVSLGIITVYQNYVSQQKTEEINRLQLQIAKRSMALAEQTYKKQIEGEENKLIPKFELKNSCSNGMYSNLIAVLKNVSSNMVSDLRSLSFEVFNSENRILLSLDKIVSEKTSLSSGEETRIEFHNKVFRDEVNTGIGIQHQKQAWNNITVIWKFQCDDECSKIHYYEARLEIEDCGKFTVGPWEVKKIG